MASQITATLPTLDFPLEADYPTQEDWAAFSAAAELNFGILGGSWSTQMQLWKNEANAMSTELNTNSTIAQGLANYQGDWTSKGYTIGQTVSVSGIYYICKLTHATGQNPTTDSSIYWNLALGNWNLKVDTNMSGYTSKTTPVDADLIPLSDSTSTFGIKKLSWANIKATLKTYFDTLYVTLSGNQTIAGVKTFTSSPIVPTPTAQDNSTKVATTAYVDGKMVLRTAVNSTSGTAIDFTGIPSWVKKITVMFNGVSTSGTSLVQLQLGDSGGVETTGYNTTSSAQAGGITGVSTYTSCFTVAINITATTSFQGRTVFTNINSNEWIGQGSTSSRNGDTINNTVGSKTLSATLDRIRITTANGTDTFDGGQINIMYEG